MALIILPQAMRIALPALTNQFIVTLKDTSIVAIAGLFDLTGIAQAAMRNPDWSNVTLEAYVFIALVYFSLCFLISLFSSKIEKSNQQEPRLNSDARGENAH